MSDMWEERMADRARERAAARRAQRRAETEREADESAMAGLVAMVIPPRIDADHCGHGHVADLSFDEVPFAGGRGLCECCGSSFGVLGSGMILYDASVGEVIWEHSRTQMETLCRECGARDEIVNNTPPPASFMFSAGEGDMHDIGWPGFRTSDS